MADNPSDNANLQNLASIQLQGVKNIGLLIQAFQNSFPGQFVLKPANSTASGTPNQVAYDATHLYLCIATNVWVRATLATF
jgi:hypothetical protein